MKRKTVTVDQVMAVGPCQRYDRATVKKLFDGRKRLDARDIAGLDIPLRDRLWALSRLKLISHEALIAFSVDLAIRAQETVEMVELYAVDSMANGYRSERALFGAAYAAAAAADLSDDLGNRLVQDESLLAYVWDE